MSSELRVKMIHFEHIEYLWLLLVVAACGLLWSYAEWRNRRKLETWADRQMFGRLIPDRSRWRPAVKMTLTLTGFALLVVALANPQMGTKIEKGKRAGSDVAICLDVSNSMMAEDIQPNRLERSKRVVNNIMGTLAGDRISLIVFAGASYIQMPLTNDYGAAKSLTQLMLAKGAVCPAYIGVDPEDKAAGDSRRRGFERAVLQAGLELRKEFSEIADFTIDSGYEKARKLLSGRKRPDCIFCATDSIAVGAMLYCREAGIRIPDDIMIAAVGDSKIGKIAAVPITTAHLHYRTAGSEAAKMLLSAIKDPSLIPRMLQLDYYIVERESTEKHETV